VSKKKSKGQIQEKEEEKKRSEGGKKSRVVHFSNVKSINNEGEKGF